MNVSNLKPDVRIAAYVERILVIEHSGVGAGYSLPLFANGSPTLLFNSVKGIMGNSNTTHLTLFGQTISPGAITFKEDFTLIAYFFRPFSLYSIFGIAAAELTDKPVDLYLLAPGKAMILTDRLLHAGSVKNMIALLDDYILGLIADVESDCGIAGFAADRISRAPSKESLALVQQELHLTERTFQRMFEKNIGVAPNLYRRICQFNSAFQQLNNRQYNKLSDIAFSNGYADQSHYIRAFKEFTNLTPGDYLSFGDAP